MKTFLKFCVDTSEAFQLKYIYSHYKMKAHSKSEKVAWKKVDSNRRWVGQVHSVQSKS